MKYKQEGLRETFRAGRKYTHSKLLRKYFFTPWAPPFSIYFKNYNFDIGMRNKYILHDRKYSVKPKKNDTVIEAGVYHGKDTAIFAKLAENVIGFEPSPRNLKIARRNLSKFNNIKLQNSGLWFENDDININYAANPSDDGILKTDSKTVHRTKSIQVYSLEDFATKNNISKIDFLKVEAEGAEPEIIKGLGNLDVRDIVINAGAERNSKSPGKEIIELLYSKGYNLVGVKEGRILFFTSEPINTEHQFLDQHEAY